MNDALVERYRGYVRETSGDRTAAAILLLAEILTAAPPPLPPGVEQPVAGFWTVREAAHRLGVSSKTVYRLHREGRLRAFRAGRAIRVPKDEITRLAAEGSLPPSLPAPAPGNRYGVL